MKLIKLLGALVLISALIITSFFLYYSRTQTIDFSKMLGNEVLVCNQTIDKNHTKYIQLKSWLQKNKTGWKNTPASVLQEYIYSSKDLNINVSTGWVVINYGNSENRSQVNISADTTDIIGKCSK